MKQFADWLFLKFCNPDFYTDIRGDLEEIYDELLQEHSVKKANFFYLKEVLLLFRWSLLKPIPKSSFFYQSFLFNPMMLKSYFLLGFRHLFKNPLISLFNLLGLSLAIACGTVIFIFLDFEYKVDHFHRGHERIFLAGFVKDKGNYSETYGYIPEAIGDVLATEFPRVEETVAINETRGIVQHKEDAPFYEKITFSDKNFLEVFNFPLEIGTINELSDPSKIIISQQMAEKYFGQYNPVGEILKITIGENEPIELIVGGVATTFPHKRSFDFSILANREIWKEMHLDRDPWLYHNKATFVKTISAQDIFEINNQIDKQLPYFAQKRNEEIKGNFTFLPLSTLSLETYRVRNDISKGHGNYSGKMAFAIIGLLLLTIACLNYINTATAQGAKRIKEIGVRKVIGGKKSSIIFQFLIENLILNFVALVFGIIIAYLFLLPAFDGLFSFGLRFEWNNLDFWFFVLAILLVSTILSGAYPAFYLSKFQPGTILKGAENIRFKNTFSKIFLTIQFFIAFVYIVVGLLFSLNTSYQQSKEIGYQTEDVLVIKPKSEAAYSFLSTEIANSAYSETIAGANQNVAYSWHAEDVTLGNLQNEVMVFEVSDNYLQTLSFNLLQGKVPILGENNISDQIVVNETFIKTFEAQNIFEQVFIIDDKKYFIAGVVEDFHHQNFNGDIEPILFKFKNAKAYTNLIVRVSNGNETLALEEAEHLWKQVSPNTPFNGHLQSSIYDSYFSFMKGVDKVTFFASLLAVLLSCSGLFGLVYLNLTSRLKDYSILKVMGANSIDIAKKILQIFITFLLVAIVLGFPVSLYGAKMLFDVLYKNHIPINLLYPIISAFFLIAISVITISALIYKVNKQNPVVALRKE